METTKYRRDSLIEAGLLFSLFYLPGYLFISTLPDRTVFDSLVYNFQLWAILIPQILTIMFLIYKDRKLSFISFGIRSLKIKDFPYFIFALAGIALLTTGLQWIFALLPQGLIPEGPFWHVEHKSMVVPILISSILTGYSEELFFRSYLFTRLTVIDASPWNRLIIVNLIFATGHLYQGLPGGITALVLGMFFSFIFIKKRNIHITAIVHGLYNFTALLISLYM